jgi:hypothetical protein
MGIDAMIKHLVLFQMGSQQQGVLSRLDRRFLILEK